LQLLQAFFSHRLQGDVQVGLPKFKQLLSAAGCYKFEFTQGLRFDKVSFGQANGVMAGARTQQR
jgi:hypothetical protein